jgi:hypothetical protein
MDLTKLLEEAEPSLKQTGSMGKDYFILLTHYPDNTWMIMDNDGYGLLVKFNDSHVLTIFEHDLLYFLFILKEKPADYANYFKCPAGKEFMDSIISVQIKQKTITWDWVDYEMHR